MMNRDTPDAEGAAESSHRPQGFWIILIIGGVLILPTALTLHRVVHPGTFQLDATDPTPLGYTWSLLLFLVPMVVLGGWLRRRRDLTLVRKSFRYTILVLAPLGVLLDLLFGNSFFTFPNRKATLGLDVPAVGGGIPIEEFVFYLTGFMLVLLSYVWADEYWVRAYNIPDYRSRAKDLRRIAEFHVWSVVVGVALIVPAFAYRKILADSSEGGPWYFTYLVAAAFVPAAGFFRTARPFINWRAFSLTFFLILLISLLWEVTLAMPYGWWGYRPSAMMGLRIAAWQGLPIEAVCVWMSVSFTTVIVYEVIKIWQALGKDAAEAFFGIRPDSTPGPIAPRDPG